MKMYIRAVLLLALILMPVQTFAQDDETTNDVIIVGNNYEFFANLMTNLVNDFQTAEGDETIFDFDLTGATDGFASLCDGSADAAMSTREITEEELLACEQNGIRVVELFIAAEGLVLAANADAAVACTDVANLSRIFLSDEPPTWDDLSTEGTDETITVYGPSDTAQAVSVLRALLDEVGFIPNYEEYESPVDVIPTLQDATNNALAFMTLNDWENLDNTNGVQLIELNSAESEECIPPTSGNLNAGDYPAARTMWLYVNSTNLQENEALYNLLQYGFGETQTDERPLISLSEASGFTPPVQATLDRNLNNINGPITGRTFTRDFSPVTLNTLTEGEITIPGTSASTFATREVYSTFNARYTEIQIELEPADADEAWTALCSGDVSVIQVNRMATEDELALCEENGIEPFDTYLGVEAVVFVVSPDADLPTCISYEELDAMLLPTETAATPSEADTDDGTTEEGDEDSDDESTDDAPQGPTHWNEINSEWPDRPLVVLVPSIGAIETDIVISRVAQAPVLRRTDAPVIMETPDDAALDDLDYRLGGLLNTDEAITLTYWSDLVNHPTYDQLQLVAIDAGDGCIDPSPEHFEDGSYPFALSAHLVFSQTALSDETIAALLWHTHTDAALDAIAELELVGFDREALEAEQDNLFTLIEDAIAAAEAEETTTQESTSDGDNAEGEAPTIEEDTTE